jgi:predicted nucleotidyltransferase
MNSNSFGLLPSDLNFLIQLFQKFPSIQEVHIFGSRAKGNFKKGSDVDLSIKGEHITFEEINQLDDELNELSNLPYKFDLVHYAKIESIELKEHIDRIGRVIYKNTI